MPGYLRLILIMEMFTFLIVYMGLYGAVERLSTDVVYSSPAARNIPLNHGLNHGLTYNLLFSL